MSLTIGKLTLWSRLNICRILNRSSNSAFRKYSSRKDCADYNDPVCSKKNLERLGTCPAKKRRLERKQELPEPKSMWENPECCTDPCPDYLARFDELYYRPSDKVNRKYQQTWVGCPKLQIKPRKVCKFDQLEFPPFQKRERKSKPKTACPAKPGKCMDKSSVLCRRITLPGCQGVRYPPKCKVHRSPSECKKECAPYPSFSECQRDPSEALHPRECNCLDNPMMCEVWAEMRRRMVMKK